MVPILCLDKNNSLNFLGKRLSFDRVLIQKLWQELNGQKLYLSEYSASLFEQYLSHDEMNNLVICSPEKLKKLDVTNPGFIFIENILPDQAFWENCHEIWLFYWNRHYPKGEIFNWTAVGKFNCFYTEDFVGYSHPQITFCKYRRVN